MSQAPSSVGAPPRRDGASSRQALEVTASRRGRRSYTDAADLLRRYRRLLAIRARALEGGDRLAARRTGAMIERLRGQCRRLGRRA